MAGTSPAMTLRINVAPDPWARFAMKAAAKPMLATMIVVLTVAFACAGKSTGAHAQTAQDFYKGKQIRLISGHPVGGDYDVGARFLAKYLSKHIPGEPAVVVQNMPQAASIVAANFLYNQAPRDGTVIGSFSRNFPSQALLGQSNIKADPRKFNWLGGYSQPSRICVAWHTAPVKTMDDLFTKELITAGGGAGSSLSIVSTVLNHVLGAKFRVVEGYKGINDAMLAIERGEVQGVCMSLAQFNNYGNLIREGKLRILFHAEEEPVPQIPNVPSIYAHAKTDEQRQLLRFVFSSSEFGRPYVFPPGVPKERVALMRKAFADVAKDKEMLAEAKKLKLDMSYIPPKRIERLIANLYQTPPAMIATVKKLIPHQR
jgi:tripartite-type tricarboxylate transporter receptor subunit TctC